MHKVVTINLNGQAYQLDENAYDALRAYLDRAETQLRDNPDRTEILADLEQAIADKCQRYLSAHKTVVSAGEITQVIEEMGPVETGTGESRDTGATSTPPAAEKSRGDAGAPRRLYRITEGALIGGVCNGLAAFFSVDVTLLRAVAIVLAIVELAIGHSGLVVLLYFVMMFVLPAASTSEEKAAASGVPFNAQEVVDRAMRNIAAFKDDDWRHQKREWRRQHREWRRQLRRTIRAEHWWGGWGFPGPPAAGYGARVIAGLMIPVLAIVSLMLLWVFLYALISLVSTGAIRSWRVGAGVPIWVAILALVLVYNAVSWPLHAARRASYHALGGPYYGWYAAGDGMMSIALVALMIWLGYRYVPEVREFIQRLPLIWENLRDGFQSVQIRL